MSGADVTTTVRLRTMVPADVAAVAAIEAAVAPEPWSVGLFEGEFSVDPATRHWVVAEDGDEIIGFAGMMFVGAAPEIEGHIMNIAVRPDHRRRGVATTMCGQLLDVAASLGVDAVTLEVRVSNRGAIELYRRFGFAPVGNRPGYYTNPDGTKEDALIFWLHDNLSRPTGSRLNSSQVGSEAGDER